MLTLALLCSAPAVAGRTSLTGAPDLSQYATKAEVPTLASAVTTLTSSNITMPNGANIAHTIYQGRGAVSISGTGEQTVFSATGDGSQTIQPVAMFVGARFTFDFAGRGQTGLANVSTVTGRVKFGVTTVATGATLALPISVSAIPFAAHVRCTILTTGVSGSAMCTGTMNYASGVSSAASLSTDVTSVTAITINTTVPQKLDATVQLSSTVGSPSLAVYDAYIIQEN